MKIIKIFIEASALAEERMSGIGHAILEIVRALEKHPENGVTFEIVLVAGFDKTKFLKRWGLKSVKYYRIPCPQRLYNLFWKFDLLPPMDILLGKGVYVFGNYKNWRLLVSKSITYVHDVSFLLYPEFVNAKNRQFLAKNMPRWIKRTTIVAADSNSAASEIKKFYPASKNKLVVLHHGVNPSQFYPRSSEEIKKVKKKNGIIGDYIFYLGNIEPRKNIVRLIEAYKQLPKSLRDKYSLVLVGGSGWLNGPILEAINQAKKDGYNIFHPTHFVEDEDLPALHSGAILLVHPAIYEGFGLSIVQAMSCGTPVVAGNNSSMVEVVGDAGVLVNVDNVEDISATIGRLLQGKNLRASLSKRGVEQAAKYNWNLTVNKLLDLIKEMKLYG